jgi:hypothetical protein
MKTIRSRFDHEVGETVEGARILERRVVIPPDEKEKRRGVYEYIVEAPPVSASKSKSSAKSSQAPERGSFTRATPEEMGGVIRRVPSR